MSTIQTYLKELRSLIDKEAKLPLILFLAKEMWADQGVAPFNHRHTHGLEQWSFYLPETEKPRHELRYEPWSRRELRGLQKACCLEEEVIPKLERDQRKSQVAFHTEVRAMIDSYVRLWEACTGRRSTQIKEPTDYEQAILVVIGDSEKRRKDIETGISGENLNPESVAQTLPRMIEKNFIEKVKRGVYKAVKKKNIAPEL